MEGLVLFVVEVFRLGCCLFWIGATAPFPFLNEEEKRQGMTGTPLWVALLISFTLGIIALMFMCNLLF